MEVYSQRDTRWAASHYGLPAASRNSTIGAYGCAITCIAQLLTYLGWTTTPPEVQAALLNSRGFREDQTHNLVNWWTVPLAFPQFQYNGRHDYPNTALPRRVLTLIEDRLRAGQPVIIYVDARRFERGLQQHFVLVTGQMESGDLVIANPWNGRMQDLREYGSSDVSAVCGVILLDLKFDASKAA